MTDRKEPPDRDEIEKRRKIKSDLLDVLCEAEVAGLPSELCMVLMADHILANFVSKEKHERIVGELKEEIKGLNYGGM